MGKKNQKSDQDDVPQLTKEETAIAKFLRLKCPNRQGNLVGMKVNFFIGNKLVDCLMESKWGPGTTKEPETSSSSKKTKIESKKDSSGISFATRQACVSFMQRLMNKQLFYRAVKIYKEETPAAAPAPAVSENESSNEPPKSTPDLRKRATTTNKESSSKTNTPATATTTQKESKKKFKLEMHEEQRFLDSNEPFVWIYDPTSTLTYVIGLLLIFGSIGICLFPLWPSQVREGVYYLSLAGATFLGAILAIAVLKYVIFGLIWAFTFGKVQFWLFPNLTEDVGFLESFVPLYVFGGGKVSNNKRASKSVEETAASAVLVAEDPIQAEESSAKSTPVIVNKKLSNEELSKSTLMINSLASDSPLLLKSKRNSTKDDDEFELVDNIKEDSNEDEINN
jgi:translocation protein SEC62